MGKLTNDHWYILVSVGSIFIQVHCYPSFFCAVFINFALIWPQIYREWIVRSPCWTLTYPLAWIFSFPLCLFILRLHKGFVPSPPPRFFSWALFGPHMAWFQPVRCIVPPAPAWPWRSPGRASARQASHLERFVISHQVPLLLHLCSASFPWTYQSSECGLPVFLAAWLLKHLPCWPTCCLIRESV